MRSALLQVRSAGGEIEHGRHAAIGREREEGDRRADAGGQQHADAFARAGAALQRMAQREAGAHDLVIGKHAVVAIDQGRRAAAEFRARIQQSLEDRTMRRFRIERNACRPAGGIDLGDAVHGRH